MRRSASVGEEPTAAKAEAADPAITRSGCVHNSGGMFRRFQGIGRRPFPTPPGPHRPRYLQTGQPPHRRAAGGRKDQQQENQTMIRLTLQKRHSSLFHYSGQFSHREVSRSPVRRRSPPPSPPSRPMFSRPPSSSVSPIICPSRASCSLDSPSNL